jgi:hypothetical protein
MRSIDVAERPVLPWPYVAILVGEAAVLALVATTCWPEPPFVYELGWAGVASLVAMQIYSLRRRVRRLRHVGSLQAWLDAHIFLGLQGYLLVAYHSVGVSAKLELAAINFALVTIVVMTGLVGRYLFGLVARRSSVAERWFARWTLLHRPLAVLLLGITTLHVLAHFAYAA